MLHRTEVNGTFEGFSTLPWWLLLLSAWHTLSHPFVYRMCWFNWAILLAVMYVSSKVCVCVWSFELLASGSCFFFLYIITANWPEKFPPCPFLSSTHHTVNKKNSILTHRQTGTNRESIQYRSWVSLSLSLTLQLFVFHSSHIHSNRRCIKDLQ